MDFSDNQAIEYDNKGYALIYESQSGGKVFKNRDAQKDSERQLYVAIALADMGYEVKILPFIPEPEVPDKNIAYKNPDFKINGRITELKGYDHSMPKNWQQITESALNNAVDQFKKRSPHGQAEVIIIDFADRKGSIKKVEDKLWNALKLPSFKKGIDEVWFFADSSKGSVLAKITRNEVVDKNYYSLKAIREAYV